MGKWKKTKLDEFNNKKKFYQDTKSKTKFWKRKKQDIIIEYNSKIEDHPEQDLHVKITSVT